MFRPYSDAIPFEISTVTIVATSEFKTVFRRMWPLYIVDTDDTKLTRVQSRTLLRGFNDSAKVILTFLEEIRI